MGLIKEPVDVDFYVTGKQMTEEEHKRVIDFMARQKNQKKSTGVKAKKADKQSA